MSYRCYVLLNRWGSYDGRENMGLGGTYKSICRQRMVLMLLLMACVDCSWCNGAAEMEMLV